MRRNPFSIMNSRSLQTLKRRSLYGLLLATSVSLPIGCSSLPLKGFAAKEKQPTQAPSHSPISQLGTALPAMKPGDERELCVIAGDEMCERQYWKEAIELYRNAEAMDTTKGKLDDKLAAALAADEQFEESIMRYRRLIAKTPNDAELRNNFAWTLMESGNLVEAESEFQRSIALAPESSKARVNLGVMQARQKRYDEALATLEPAIGLAAAHHNIGVIAIENQDEPVALKAFQEATHRAGAPKASAEFLAGLQGSKPLTR